MKVAVGASILALGALLAQPVDAAGTRASDVATVAPPFQDMAGLVGPRSLDAIRRARLFLAIAYQESAASLTQQQLMRTGCSFETVQPPPLARLAVILRHAHVVRAPEASRRELRRLLILEFKDGTESHFELGAGFRTDDLLVGSIDGIAVTADKMLGDALVEWARSLTEKSDCSKNLDYYR